MAKKKTPSSRAEQKAATQARRTARQEKAARAAEAQQAQQQARKRKERMIAVGVVLVIALIVALVAWALARSGKDATPPANVTDTYAMSVGEEDAEHTVVIYEDFLCPACGVLESLVAEPLGQAVAEGRARVEYRPVAIVNGADDYAERAANALAVVLDTAGVEVAKEFHDTLYAEQPGEDGDAPDDDWLVEQAVAAGADEDAVRPGIEDRQFEGWVDAANDDFSREGHRGTPTVLLDGEVVERRTVQDVATDLLAGLG